MFTLLSMVPDYINSHAIEVVYAIWLIAATGSLVTSVKARYDQKADCRNGVAECC